MSQLQRTPEIRAVPACHGEDARAILKCISRGASKIHAPIWSPGKRRGNLLLVEGGGVSVGGVGVVGCFPVYEIECV